MARVAQSLAFAAALLEECGVDCRRCFLGAAVCSRLLHALGRVSPLAPMLTFAQQLQPQDEALCSSGCSSDV